MSRPKTNDIDEAALVPDLSEDHRHRVLANHRRELIVAVLADQTTPMALDDLVAAVGDRDPRVDASNMAELDRVALDLHHVHLPLMDELDAVDYDAEARRLDSA